MRDAPGLGRAAGHTPFDAPQSARVLGCFIAYLDIQLVSASIQEIGGGLSASQDVLSWIQSSYWTL
jgi:DHA2 family multidrug resistance protein